MYKFIKNLESIISKGKIVLPAIGFAAYTFVSTSCQNPISTTRYELPSCKESINHCDWDPVTRITDGDTLHVLSEERGDITVRIPLANTPERGQIGYQEATAYHAYLCPVGTIALIDQDDGQPYDRSGRRMVALVWCYDRSLRTYVKSSEAMIKSGHAILDRRFCSISEFGKDPWAIALGCQP